MEEFWCEGMKTGGAVVPPVLCANKQGRKAYGEQREREIQNEIANMLVKTCAIKKNEIIYDL